MKLQEKTRVGSKVIKKYDVPRTPYHRVLAHADVPGGRKQNLCTIRDKLNPADLKRKITKLQNKLFAIAERKSHQRRSSQRIKSVYINA